MEEVDKIKELETTITNLQFFSDQVKFNSLVFNGLNIILEKLMNIEEKLNLPKLPELPDGKV